MARAKPIALGAPQPGPTPSVDKSTEEPGNPPPGSYGHTLASRLTRLRYKLLASWKKPAPPGVQVADKESGTKLVRAGRFGNQLIPESDALAREEVSLMFQWQPLRASTHVGPSAKGKTKPL